MNIYAVTALFTKREREVMSDYMIATAQIAASSEAAKAAVVAEYGPQQALLGYKVEGVTCVYIDDAFLAKAGYKRP